MVCHVLVVPPDTGLTIASAHVAEGGDEETGEREESITVGDRCVVFPPGGSGGAVCATRSAYRPDRLASAALGIGQCREILEPKDRQATLLHSDQPLSLPERKLLVDALA